MTRGMRIAAAALAAVALPSAAIIGDLPAERTQGTATYRTGGVGLEEAQAMKKVQADYPLALEFVHRAEPRAEYLAGIKVTVLEYDGDTALQAVSDGPFLFARLPDGKYSVLAEWNGNTKIRLVELAANEPRRVVFEW